MKKIRLILSMISVVILFSSLSYQPASEINLDDKTVWEVLMSLGAEAPNHMPNEAVKGASAEAGENIVKRGIASKPSGGKTSKQSNHFVCTSCHNVVKEQADLTSIDPQERLEYAKLKGIPFLQGTTLFGAVNRTSFYNDDYEKKYGDLVKPARNDLREAIQLCAIECSQGRTLYEWELESVLKYLWTLEYKMSDLKLTQEGYAKLEKTKKKEVDKVVKNNTIDFIQSQYRKDSPAHFVKPPEDRKAGYPFTGNPENGKLIYELSCLHCHEKERYSAFNLDDSENTFEYLKKHFSKYTRYSVYQVTRYGTSPVPGKRSYMPQYTMEKMSNQQLEDLRAYIEQEAK